MAHASRLHAHQSQQARCHAHSVQRVSFAPRSVVQLGASAFISASPVQTRRQAAQGRCHAAQEDSQFDVDVARPQKTAEDESLGPRADDCLPDSLAGAVLDAAAATANAVMRGNTRCQVELLLPEFWDPISGPIFPNRGDQERFWKMTRRFIEQLAENSGATNIKAVSSREGREGRALLMIRHGSCYTSD
jgi:hypothetical protein